MTIRQRIFDAVISRLKSIRTANGYKTDVGASVYSWRDTSQEGQPFQEAELDAASSNSALNVKDTENVWSEQKMLSGTHEHQLTVLVDAICMRAAPAEIYRVIIGDIVSAVGRDRKWGGLAEDTQPFSESLDVIQRSRAFGGARVTFRVRYRTLSFDPYAQP